MDPAQRFGQRAFELASQAVQATESRNPRCLEALAAAQAELGDFDGATLSLQTALAVSEAGDLRDRLERHRTRVESRQPLRE